MLLSLKIKRKLWPGRRDPEHGRRGHARRADLSGEGGARQRRTLARIIRELGEPENIGALRTRAERAMKDPAKTRELLDEMTLREYLTSGIMLARNEPVGDKRFRGLLSQARSLISPKIPLPEILQRCAPLFGMKSADAIYERDIRLAKPKPPPMKKMTRSQRRKFARGEWY